MRVGDLGSTALRTRLAEGHFFLRSGPFIFAITTENRFLANTLGLLYRDFSLLDDTTYADFHVSITRRYGVIARLVGGLDFVADATSPFGHFSANTAPSYTEWGLNWCIHRNVKRFLLIHAATVAKDGAAVMIVGESGQGKSTLCAALVASGWRLLSDEFAVIDMDGALRAMPRPISLKNESIAVIRRLYGDLEFGPEMTGTIKGTIAHVCPPRDSVEASGQAARAQWIVFPEYRADAKFDMTELPKAQAFVKSRSLEL